MRKTYANNAITIGFLLGLGATMKAGILVGIIVAFAVSIGGFYLIRAFENAVLNGINKSSDALSNRMYEHKKEKNGIPETHDLADHYK